MKTQNRFLLPFIALIIFLGCKKKLPQTNNTEIRNIDNILCAPEFYAKAEYYKEFLNSNRLGIYTINSYTSDGVTQFTAGGFFYPNAKRQSYIKIGDNVFINGMHINEYNPTSGAYSMIEGVEKQLPQLFGNQLTILIANNSTNKTISNTTIDLYSPMKFDVNIPIEYLDRNKPFTINWNSDVQNKNGVAVVVDWSAALSTPKTDGTLGLNYSGKIVRNVDIVEDLGVYVFDGKKMLKDIPKDAMVDIAIYRGSYKIITINDNIDSRFQSYSEWHSSIRNVIN